MRAIPGSRRGQAAAMGAWLLAAGAALPAGAFAQGFVPRVMAPDSVLDGNEAEPLRWPVAVAVASESQVGVADAWRPRLLVFERIGASWGLTRAAPLAAAPSALAWDGRRFVVGLRGGGVVRVDSAGAVENVPEAASLVVRILAGGPAGTVLAYDAAGGRVVRLDGDGRILDPVAVDAPVSALATDGAGGFWAAFGEAGEVRRYSSQGDVVARFRIPGEAPVPAWPVGIAAEPAGRLFVLDRHGARLVVLDAGGRVVGLGSGDGWELGQLRFPAALARLPSGALVVADQGNGRVQIFRLLGELGR